MVMLVASRFLQQATSFAFRICTASLDDRARAAPSRKRHTSPKVVAVVYTWCLDDHLCWGPIISWKANPSTQLSRLANGDALEALMKAARRKVFHTRLWRHFLPPPACQTLLLRWSRALVAHMHQLKTTNSRWVRRRACSEDLLLLPHTAFYHSLLMLCRLEVSWTRSTL